MKFLRFGFHAGAAGIVIKRYLSVCLSFAVFFMFDVAAGTGVSMQNIQAAQFGYMSRLAGGVDNVESPPALTFNQISPSTSIDVDTLGRLYFEDFGKIKRIELDGSISDFSVGESVRDFKVVGELLYYVEGNSQIHSYDLVLEQHSRTLNTGIEQASFTEISVGSGNVIYVYGWAAESNALSASRMKTARQHKKRHSKSGTWQSIPRTTRSCSLIPI